MELPSRSTLGHHARVIEQLNSICQGDVPKDVHCKTSHNEGETSQRCIPYKC